MRKKIGECLVQAGLITDDDLRHAVAEHKRTGERLGGVLVRLNLATEKQIAKALAFQLGFPYHNVTESLPDPAAVSMIPKEIALKRMCIAVKLESNLLTVAMSDPLLFSLVEDLEFRTGYRIKQVVATRGDITAAITAAYPDRAAAYPERTSAHPDRAAGTRIAELPAERRVDEELADSPAGTPGVTADAAAIRDLVDVIVKGAIKSNASDIHFEPMERRVLIRQRLDGLLRETMDLPTWIHDGLVARLKIMAGMDIAEKRLPQDGRIRSVSEDGSDVDFRVSTLRTVWGEKVVMRRLEHRRHGPALEEIGLSKTSLDGVHQFLRHQHGLILVVGPAGSGRSTTLSAAIKSLSSAQTNIVTVEDPVEDQIPGVNQTQVNDKINLTFGNALKSVLRQAPDVVLVGEIRDAETARIAMQAAQTGPLVLSALPADDAPSAVARLREIGTEPHVIANALVGVIAQRLVRRLCTQCRRPSTPASDTLRALNLSEIDVASFVFYRAIGCDQCNHTGYRGRIGIYEVMTITDRLRRLIASRATGDQIRDAATSGGMVSLGEDGLAKVKSGITTPEELLRVVSEVRDLRTLCGSCGSAVSFEFLACPNCGTRLGDACPYCGRATQPGWNFCPYCARSAVEPRRPPRAFGGSVSVVPRVEPRRELPAANVAEFKK